MDVEIHAVGARPGGVKVVDIRKAMDKNIMMEVEMVPDEEMDDADAFS